MTSETMNKMLAVVMGLASVPVAACGGSRITPPPAITENMASPITVDPPQTEPITAAKTPVPDADVLGCLPFIEQAAGGPVDVEEYYDKATIESEDAAQCCVALADALRTYDMRFHSSGCCDVIGGVDDYNWCFAWGPPMPPAMA